MSGNVLDQLLKEVRDMRKAMTLVQAELADTRTKLLDVQQELERVNAFLSRERELRVDLRVASCISKAVFCLIKAKEEIEDSIGVIGTLHHSGRQVPPLA
jgi:hypothetical protein